MKLLTPENLNLRLIELIEQEIPDGREKKLLLKTFEEKELRGRYVHLKKLVVIISKICWGTIFKQKEKDHKDFETFVSLNSGRMRKATGCQNGSRMNGNLSLPRCMEILERIGVLEWNGHYGPGAFPKSARFTQKYRDANFVESDIPIGPFTGAQGDALIPSLREHKLDLALTSNQSLEQGLYENILRIRMAKEVYEFFNSYEWEKGENQRLWWESVVAGIESDSKERAFDWHFSRDRAGRLHSTISNLKKELRPFLRVDEEPLIEIDQHASQPFLFLSFYGQSEGEQAEAKRFHALWNGGDFYLNFARLAGIDGDAIGRDEIKDAFLKTHNSKGLWHLPRGVKRRIAEEILSTMDREFPLLAGRIREVKADDHRNFANALHAKEASIFIDRIAAELMDRGIFCATVHDSVLCRESEAESVKEIIESHLHDAIGFPAVVSAKGAEDDKHVIRLPRDLGPVELAA